MEFTIVPNVGIEGLALGSTKDAVRRYFSAEPKVFRRTPTDEPADYWSGDGVFAYYTRDGKLEALEFAAPAEAKLHGKTLTTMSMEQAQSFLRSFDPDVTVTEGGASVRSSRFGISAWCPTPNEANAQVEAVLLHGSGYCD